MNIPLKYLKKKTEIIDAQSKRLADTAKRLEKSLLQMLGDGKSGGRVIDVALARAQIQDQLVASGYYEAQDSIFNEGYQDLIDLNYKQYKEMYSQSLQYSDVSLERLKQIKDLDIEKFNTITQKTIGDLSQVMTDYAYGASDLKAATERLAAVLDPDKAQYAETVIRSTAHAFDREAGNSLASDGGFTEFEYIGPDDASTSEICQGYLGQVKTKEEWMNEGGDYPVFIYGGHPNCRHSFAAVVPDDVEGSEDSPVSISEEGVVG